jgi:hypothetical protein
MEGSCKSSLQPSSTQFQDQAAGHAGDPRGGVGSILVAQEGQGVPKSFIWVTKVSDEKK